MMENDYGLGRFSIDELVKMREGAEPTGYNKGVPLGVIAEVLRSKIEAMQNSQSATVTEQPLKLRKRPFSPSDDSAGMREINRAGMRRARSKS